MADVDPIKVQITAEFGALKQDLASAKKEIKNLGKEAAKTGTDTKKTSEAVVDLSKELKVATAAAAKSAKAIERLSKELEDSKRKMKASNEETKKTSKSFNLLGSAQGKATVAALALSAATVILIKNQVQSARTTDLWSQKLGVSTVQLSRLTAAGAQFGVEADILADAIKDLGVKITDASKGAKAYDDVFRALGLSSKELVKLSPASQIDVIADAMKKADDATRRWALDEINDSMFRLGPLLENGSAGLKDLGDEAIASGKALSSFDIQKLKGVSETFLELSTSTNALGNALALRLAPAIKGVVGFLDDLTDGLRNVVNEDPKDFLKRIEEIDKAMQSISENSTGYLPEDPFAFREYNALLDERITLEKKLASQKIDEKEGKSISGKFDPDEENRKIGEKAAADARQQAAAAAIIEDTLNQEQMAENRRIGEQAAADARQVFAAEEIILQAEENQRKLDIAKEHAANMLNLEFENALLAGEQKEAARIAEEEAQKAFEDREFGAAKRQIDRINRLQKSGWQGQLKLGGEFLGNMASAFDDGSKKSFERTKKLNMGLALMDTAASVMNAAKSAPFPANLPAMAMMAATGAAQIAQISSTSYSGGGGGGGAAPVSGGGAAVAQQAPENVIDASFNIQGSSVDTGSVRGMLGSLNELIEDGGTLRSVKVI